MKITQAMQAPESPNPHGVSTRMLCSNEHLQAVMVTLKPGEKLKLHRTPVDVLFFVVEGRGQVEIGGELQEVGPEMVIESPARIPHRLLNPGDALFRVLVLKTPRPTESTQIL